MSSNNSKPVYLTNPKQYPLLSNDDNNEGETLPRDPENCEESDAQIQSCMPSLNNKGKLMNFWLCFLLGMKHLFISQKIKMFNCDFIFNKEVL